MSHLLYQQMILDHSKKPRGFVQNPEGCCLDAHNPLCGDQLKLCIEVNDGIVSKITFNGTGCSLSIAAASLLVDQGTGLTVKAFHDLAQGFLSMLTGGDKIEGKLAVFSGVLQYPMRVKCVTMVWHAAIEVLKKEPCPITASASCIDYWKKLIALQKGLGIVLEFKQLGCFGWQFVPTVVTVVPEGKQAYLLGDVTIWIDASIVPKIQGTQVDYIEEGLQQFKVVFKHPKAVQHCGCGESFVIKDLDE